MFGGADGDANPSGQTVTAERAHDDAFFLQGKKDGVPIADFDHDIVGRAWDEAEIEFFEKGVEAIATGVGEGDSFFDVFGVGQAGEGGDLGGGGGVEGLAGFLEHGGDVGSGEAVADAESGEALHFGESSENDDGATFSDPLNGGGRFRDEFVVGFVEDEERTGGEFFDEGGQLGIGDAGAGGVVGGGEEDEADLGGEAGGETGEIVVKVAIGHFLKGNAEEAGHETVNGEGVGGGENFALAGQGESVVAEFDNFIGAAAEDDVIGSKAVKFGDGLAKGETGAVGVEMGEVERVANGLEGAGGGSERILVRGEFSDLGGLQAVFAGDVGDGPAWFIGVEVGDVGIGAWVHGF